MPKPSSQGGEIIDPYVTAEIFGIPADCIKHRTRVIDDNGFNPVWNEVFKFELRSPETAMLRLCVKDYDTTSANDFIGEFSLPVTSIRPGMSSLFPNLQLPSFLTKNFNSVDLMAK
ncbi:unnamed protein product [Gongylonema pulchrum]|uniref:C2 domain-containing protein n=1 Tax=Gongylonema pulchrum TaxID=637853 RepID=A0A3P7NCD4_9BILA|nr:unnamed protein product [Gongylonema pulchrum]